jgi:3'-phosphoadenosine 5'-phosphosulfate sulfotransferase (PAPS reductase)/FAD synthetase
MLHRLQQHNFNFKEHGNLSFEELLELYPNTRSALRWWTNNNASRSNQISWNRGLKDFLILNNGVPFTPSAYCCYGAKKLPSKQYARANNVALLMMGIRRAEGGKRATAYSSCFIPHSTVYPYGLYLPIFWWTNKDKEMFDEILDIKHSECYSEYGLRRTGCPGCPFGQRWEEEREIIAEHEPRLVKAVDNLFGISYEWTKKYRDYQQETKPPRKQRKKKGETDG